MVGGGQAGAQQRWWRGGVAALQRWTSPIGLAPTITPPNTPQEAGDALPLLKEPHDALRQGLFTLKDGAAATHPVEAIQKLAGPAGDKARLELLSNVYGTALPARMQIERQILDR